jgi:hypothetical protein
MQDRAMMDFTESTSTHSGTQGLLASTGIGDSASDKAFLGRPKIWCAC